VSDAPCSVPGCTGTVDGGYCDTCGLAAPRGAMAAALRAAAPPGAHFARSGSSAPAARSARRRTSRRRHPHPRCPA